MISLVGGSALLIYSIEELSKSVQYLAGGRFRVWINTFAGNRFTALLLGVVLAILLSSSGAVTVMLVGLANARLLNLAQVFAMTLGASIGTTLIVHLFAFRVSEYGLIMIALGVAVNYFSSSGRFTHAGRTLLFLGMMFFSMGLVVGAGLGLQKDELFRYIIAYFHDRPLVSMLIASFITAAVQSSAATMAFVMSMMVAQKGNLHQALPWVLGANLGTTATAFFASLRAGILGRQAALGHLLVKMVGIVLCFPVLDYLASFIEGFGGDIGRQIAYSHTLFNLALGILFFPFIPLGVQLVRHLFPEKPKEGPFSFQYLDPRTLNTPEMALAQAQREILRLSDTVEQMLDRSIGLFTRGSARDIESLKAMDQVVDFLNKGIKLYLTKLSQKEMTAEQVQKEFELLLRTNDLENIGDIVDKNILDLVRKHLKKGFSFSKEGWAEIVAFHDRVSECLRVSTAYFNSRDRALAAKLSVLHEQIEDMTLDLSELHVRRLHLGVKESLETTSVHLDLIGNLQRIAALSVNFTRIHGSTGLQNASVDVAEQLLPRA